MSKLAYKRANSSLMKEKSLRKLISKNICAKKKIKKGGN